MEEYVFVVQASDVLGKSFTLTTTPVECEWELLTTSQPIKTNGVEWCDIGGLNLTTTSANQKRDLGFDMAAYALDSFAGSY